MPTAVGPEVIPLLPRLVDLIAKIRPQSRLPDTRRDGLLLPASLVVGVGLVYCCGGRDGDGDSELLRVPFSPAQPSLLSTHFLGHPPFHAN